MLSMGTTVPHWTGLSCPEGRVWKAPVASLYRLGFLTFILSAANSIQAVPESLEVAALGARGWGWGWYGELWPKFL